MHCLSVLRAIYSWNYERSVCLMSDIMRGSGALNRVLIFGLVLYALDEYCSGASSLMLYSPFFVSIFPNSFFFAFLR